MKSKNRRTEEAAEPSARGRERKPETDDESGRGFRGGRSALIRKTGYRGGGKGEGEDEAADQELEKAAGIVRRALRVEFGMED